MQEPFPFNSFYLLVLKKSANSVTKMIIFPHGGKSEIFFLPYLLDLIDLLEQKFCQDSNLRVKLTYESVKKDVLNQEFTVSANFGFIFGIVPKPK